MFNFLIIPVIIMFFINLVVYFYDRKEIRLKMSASRFFIRLTTLFIISFIISIVDTNVSLFLFIVFILSKILIEDLFMIKAEKYSIDRIEKDKEREKWIEKNKHRILRFQKKK